MHTDALWGLLKAGALEWAAVNTSESMGEPLKMLEIIRKWQPNQSCQCTMNKQQHFIFYLLLLVLPLPLKHESSYIRALNYVDKKSSIKNWIEYEILLTFDLRASYSCYFLPKHRPPKARRSRPQGPWELHMLLLGQEWLLTKQTASTISADWKHDKQAWYQFFVTWKQLTYNSQLDMQKITTVPLVNINVCTLHKYWNTARYISSVENRLALASYQISFSSVILFSSTMISLMEYSMIRHSNLDCKK